MVEVLEWINRDENDRIKFHYVLIDFWCKCLSVEINLSSDALEKFELSKKTASSIIDEMAMLATNEIKKTGAFTFPGMGKLFLVKRKARLGRNPATGEQINIPAKTVVKMRVTKACKDAIVPPKKKYGQGGERWA